MATFSENWHHCNSELWNLRTWLAFSFNQGFFLVLQKYPTNILSLLSFSFPSLLSACFLPSLPPFFFFYATLQGSFIYLFIHLEPYLPFPFPSLPSNVTIFICFYLFQVFICVSVKCVFICVHELLIYTNAIVCCKLHSLLLFSLHPRFLKLIHVAVSAHLHIAHWA